MRSTAADAAAADATAGDASKRPGSRPGTRKGPDSRPPVFLADRAELAGDVITLTGPEGRHAATVRRLAAGERAEVTDGRGMVAQCVVAGAAAGTLRLAVRGRRTEPAPEPPIVVAQALLKGDRGELAVEIMTEVGVDVVVPWSAERCVARWRSDRPGCGDRISRGDRDGPGDRGDRASRALGRWRATAREAAKQSRRAWFPEITDPVDTPGLVQRAAAARLALLLDPDAVQPLAEVVDRALRPARSGRGGAARQQRDPPPPRDRGETAPRDRGETAPRDRGEIVLIIGPEGGISPAEAAALADAGARPARLGPSVLRASSAGAVAAALVLTACGRW